MSYEKIRSNIINLFPPHFISKYLMLLNFHLEVIVIPNSFDETILKFFEMNSKYYNVYKVNKFHDEEYLKNNKYECSSVELNILSFPFSATRSSRISVNGKSMGSNHLVIKLNTFKYSRLKCLSFEAEYIYEKTIMYIDFTSVRYLSLYFLTISHLKNMIKMKEEGDTKVNKEFIAYSDRENLLLFLNGYSPEKNVSKKKKYRVLDDPFWQRSVSEYLCFNNYVVDYKGEDLHSNCFM